MTFEIDLNEALADHDPVEFSKLDRAYFYKDVTAKYEFTTIVVPSPTVDRCFVVVSRSGFDEPFAVEVLRFVIKNESDVSSKAAVTILESFSSDRYQFDSIAILSPKAANQYEHEHKKLNKKAFVVFPMFRCELSGNEDIEILDVIRHEFLPSLDWKRSPSPKIVFSFQNTATAVSSTNVGLATFQTVKDEIREMDGADGSFARIVNYRKQTCHVKFEGGTFLVNVPGQPPMKCSLAKTLKLITNFVLT